MKKIFILLILMTAQQLNAMECWATRQIPAPGHVTLSNGEVLTLPARACHFDVRGLIGQADLTALQRHLLPSDLYPIAVAGKGILLISFYIYRQSDMGVFNEFYVVTPSSRTPHRGFDSLKALWQAMRANPDHSTSPQLILHHLYVRSSDASAALASREVWGIDSQLAQIDAIDIHKNQQTLSLREGGKSILQWQVKKPRWPYVSFPMDIHLNAGGFIEQLTLSPVMGEGKIRLERTQHGPKLAPGELAQLLEQLKFTPELIQWGDKLQAIQFAPVLREGPDAAKY